MDNKDELIESIRESCVEAFKRSFGEMNKEQEKDVGHNEDSIEEAKLWAIRQKKSCD